MTRAEILDTLLRMNDPEMNELVKLIMQGEPADEVLLNGLTLARQAWQFLAGRVQLVEERSQIITFLKSSAFAHDDPYVTSLISSLEAGSPVVFALLQCILLLTTERGRLIKELIALKEKAPPVSTLILKERAAQVFEEGCLWPQPMPEPAKPLFYKPEDDEEENDG